MIEVSEVRIFSWFVSPLPPSPLDLKARNTPVNVMINMKGQTLRLNINCIIFFIRLKINGNKKFKLFSFSS